MAKEFSIETLIHPETRAVLAAAFRVAGVSFNLVLGRPDNPVTWGMYRPRGIIFQNEAGEKRIEFIWPHITEQCVTLTKIGVSKERPPQWADWQE